MVCISGSNVLEYRLGSLPKKKVWITIFRQPTVLSLWLHAVFRVFLLTWPVWEVYCLGWPDEQKSIWHVQLFRYHMETKSQPTSQPFNMLCFCCGEFSCPVPSCSILRALPSLQMPLILIFFLFPSLHPASSSSKVRFVLPPLACPQLSLLYFPWLLWN